MKDSPCRNCNDRFVGCHSVCELYEQFIKYCNDIAAKREVNNLINIGYFNHSKSKRHK